MRPYGAADIQVVAVVARLADDRPGFGPHRPIADAVRLRKVAAHILQKRLDHDHLFDAGRRRIAGTRVQVHRQGLVALVLLDPDGQVHRVHVGPHELMLAGVLPIALDGPGRVIHVAFEILGDLKRHFVPVPALDGLDVLLLIELVALHAVAEAVPFIGVFGRRRAVVGQRVEARAGQRAVAPFQLHGHLRTGGVERVGILDNDAQVQRLLRFIVEIQRDRLVQRTLGLSAVLALARGLEEHFDPALLGVVGRDDVCQRHLGGFAVLQRREAALLIQFILQQAAGPGGNDGHVLQRCARVVFGPQGDLHGVARSVGVLLRRHAGNQGQPAFGFRRLQNGQRELDGGGFDGLLFALPIQEYAGQLELQGVFRLIRDVGNADDQDLAGHVEAVARGHAVPEEDLAAVDNGLALSLLPNQLDLVDAGIAAALDVEGNIEQLARAAHIVIFALSDLQVQRGALVGDADRRHRRVAEQRVHLAGFVLVHAAHMAFEMH